MSGCLPSGRAGPTDGVIEDLGRPVSHLALKEGTPVYDRSGERIGVVDNVMADEATGIFEGLVVHTLPLPGRHVYAHHDQIAELHERGVLLTVDRDALHPLEKPSDRRSGADEVVEHPLEAILRRAWDRVSGLR
jgi:sporulation protein YlmC with PRC-barrel domain